MNNPLILHLYDDAPIFDEHNKAFSNFHIHSSLFSAELLMMRETIGVIIGTSCLSDIHCRALEESLKRGQRFIIAILSPVCDIDLMQRLSLMTQCVYIPCENLSENYHSLGKMFDNHAKALNYQETLKLRTQNSGMVDSINIVAHQWRQPINLISIEAINLSILSTLNPTVPSDTVSISAQLIADQSQRMSDILKSVLSMGKNNRGREPFSLNDALERIRLFFANTFERHHIDYRFTPLKEDIFLYGYVNDFEEVLVNLISNAKEAFLPTKSEYQPWIELYLESDETSLHLYVRDNAGGVPEAIREKIFEPHFSTKGEGEGFGIGLHVARMIVEQEYKGTLNMNVKNGQTEFMICFPRTDSSQLTFITV